MPEADDHTYGTRRDLTVRAPDRVGFPIDAVYTWVDGSDPEWLERKRAALGGPDGELHAIAANSSRYQNRDELRYSMRSLHSFAPWLRKIFLVTDGQLPSWLDPSHPMITVVSHAELFADLGGLSSFNSHAIEARLHRIEGLAEHFLYLNDDVFLGRPLLPTHFFHANGIAKFFLSPAQFGLGEAKPTDPPVNAAGKNNRRHIQRQFGVTITQKMKHTPFALRRSIMHQIEAVLQADVTATAQHRFRHHEDLSIPSSLHQYWAYLTAQASRPTSSTSTRTSVTPRPRPASPNCSRVVTATCSASTTPTRILAHCRNRSGCSPTSCPAICPSRHRSNCPRKRWPSAAGRGRAPVAPFPAESSG